MALLPEIDPQALAQKVLRRVGKPSGFIKAEAKHLYDECWRVNVWSVVNNNTVISHSEVVKV